MASFLVSPLVVAARPALTFVWLSAAAPLLPALTSTSERRSHTPYLHTTHAMTMIGSFEDLALSGGSGDDADGRDGGGDHDAFPLLDRLLEELPEVLERFVLPAMDHTALALLARVGRAWCAAVMSSGLPRAGTTRVLPFKLNDFWRSVERLAWAKANGCPWSGSACDFAAEGGHLDVLMWAREHDCPWSESTCTYAAEGGHLDVLMWAREHDCPWDEETCRFAAVGGYLDVLVWAREHGCPWNSIRVHMLPRAGTWTYSSGRWSMAAHGTRGQLHTPLPAAT